MARSRSYEKSRRKGEYFRRTVPGLREALDSFEEEVATDDEPIEVEPPLRYWLSPRSFLDLHRDQARLRQEASEDPRFWYYASIEEPIFARAA